MKIIEPVTITDSMITACNVTETDPTYPDWSVSTAYLVGDLVTSNHKFYECLIANTGFLPEDSIEGTSPKWLDLGYNNRWKMFDQKVGSQTSISEQLTITLEPGAVDSIAFLDVDATEITIVMTDPTEGVVYSDTIDLVSKSGIVDWYTYFISPIITDDSVVLLGVPPYTDCSISITITKPSGTVLLGTLAVGMQADIGCTQFEPTVSINDYSKKTTDIYGNFEVLERVYSKQLSAQTMLPNTSLDSIVSKLSAYRAKPVIWVGADVGYSSMIIYGFYRSFSVAVKYTSDSVCSLEIEGLT